MRAMKICALLVSVAGLAGCGEFQNADAAESITISTIEGSDWELVWSDEFEGDELDRTKWIPEESCWGGGNDERQCYTDRPENISVEDGVLLLKARREEWTGPDRPPEIAEVPNPQRTKQYTSGKVRTRGLHAWQYGRIEMRARIPAGQGIWPAFWMMPADDHYGRWPLSGEIDILEAVNIGAQCLQDECDSEIGENRTVSAVHYGDYAPDNRHVAQRTPLPSGALPSDDFHVFSVEWGEGLIRFLVDDRVHFTVTPDDWDTASPLAEGNPNAPFDKPFYVMMNLAVGGAWPEREHEKGLAESSIPAQFAIDWVRVYQCASDRETGRACIDQGK